MQLSLQFFGGRGANSTGGTSEGNMGVPYDRWGQMISKEVRDEDGTVIGYIEDVERYVYEDYVEPVTKQAVLDDIDAWRNDDGTYGDNDVSINLAYKDGTFVDVNSLDGKTYKKTGIVHRVPPISCLKQYNKVVTEKQFVFQVMLRKRVVKMTEIF